MQDLDDWDLEDKSFCWADDVVESTNPLFQLNKDSGMITMQAGKIKPGVYDLSFLVDDRKHGQTAIPAYVTVNVIELPQNFHSFAASLRIRYKLINFYIFFLIYCTASRPSSQSIVLLNIMKKILGHQVNMTLIKRPRCRFFSSFHSCP